MMVAQNIRRQAPRMVALLAVTVIVVGATYLVMLPDSSNRAEAANIGRAKSIALDGDIPTPGSEEVLRRIVGEMNHGNLDHAGVSEETPESIRQQLGRYAQVVSILGPLQAVTYLGADARGDIYRVAFKNGSLVCGIVLGWGRTIERLSLAAPEGPTPQDWVDNYALVTTGKDTARVVLAFAKLLGVVGLGRLAGIRL
jgi:hypothetical protein